jgi:hypothetical protein
MGNGFIITEPSEIRYFATRSALARTLLEKRVQGIKNACVAVGTGFVGIFNNKSGRFYIQFDIDKADGNPASQNEIVETLNLLSLAKTHKVNLIGVEVA